MNSSQLTDMVLLGDADSASALMSCASLANMSPSEQTLFASALYCSGQHLRLAAVFGGSKSRPNAVSLLLIKSLYSIDHLAQCVAVIDLLENKSADLDLSQRSTLTVYRGLCLCRMGNILSAKPMFLTAANMNPNNVRAIHACFASHLFSPIERRKNAGDLLAKFAAQGLSAYVRSVLECETGKDAQLSLDELMGAKIHLVPGVLSRCVSKGSLENASSLAMSVLTEGSIPSSLFSGGDLSFLSACGAVLAQSHLDEFDQAQVIPCLFDLASQLLQICPNSPHSWYLAGCYYYMVEKFDMAIKFFDKSTRCVSSNSRVQGVSSTVNAHGQVMIESARKGSLASNVNSSLSTEGTSIGALTSSSGPFTSSSGAISSSSGALTSAGFGVSSSVLGSCVYGPGHLAMGHVHSLLGDVGSAESSFVRSIRLMPGSVEPLLFMAQHCVSVDETLSEARHFLLMALALDDQDPLIKNELGCVEFLLGDVDYAMKRFTEIVAQESALDAASSDLPSASSAEGVSALSSLKRTKRNRKDIFRFAYGNLGMCCLKLGEVSAAVEALSRATEFTSSGSHSRSNRTSRCINRFRLGLASALILSDFSSNALKAIDLLHECMLVDPEGSGATAAKLLDSVGRRMQTAQMSGN